MRPALLLKKRLLLATGFNANGGSNPDLFVHRYLWRLLCLLDLVCNIYPSANGLWYFFKMLIQYHFKGAETD